MSPELLRGQPDTETGHPVIKWYSWANVLNVQMQNIFTNVVYVVRYVKDLVKRKMIVYQKEVGSAGQMMNNFESRKSIVCYALEVNLILSPSECRLSVQLH